MGVREVMIAAVVLGLVCCAIMWLLEDFRQRKMLAELRSWLDTIPTVGEASS